MKEKPNGDAVRVTRYKDAELLNLSLENEDVTFIATLPTVYAEKEAMISRWAYFMTNLAPTLKEAIMSKRKVSLLVCRYRLVTEGKDKKPNYDFLDVIEDAAMI